MTTLNKSFWEHHFEGYNLSNPQHLSALNAVFQNAFLLKKDLIEIFLLNSSEKEGNGLSILFKKINEQGLAANQVELDLLVSTI